MTVTENVYVIKVKTKPPLSSLYPSERRYSASTVGGLSLVHFGLGALSLLLGTLALSLQGPILSVACLVPFVTGLLAWRRWYIDRNIAIFFYGSLVSLVVATLCFVVTIFDVAAASGGANGAGRSLWSLEEIFDVSHPGSPHPLEEPANDTRADDIALLSKGNPFNATDESGTTSSGTELDEIDLHGGYDDLKAEATFELQEGAIVSKEILRNEDAANVTRGSPAGSKREETLWRGRYENSSHAKTLLTLNVLVASLLEVFWSLLSAKIAFRGMMNRLPESNNAVAGSKTARQPLHKRKPPAPRPDILDHDSRRLSESLQNFTSLQCLAGPRLPLPESNREFRERVERFLANQATHGTVEGV